MTGWIDDSSVLKGIAYSDLRLCSYIRMYVYEIETARASNGEKWMHADLFLPLCSHATIMSTPWIGRTNTRFGFRNVSGILEEWTEEGTWDGANRFRDRNETSPRMIDEFFILFLEAWKLFCMHFDFFFFFFEMDRQYGIIVSYVILEQKFPNNFTIIQYNNFVLVIVLNETICLMIKIIFMFLDCSIY